MIDTGKDKDAKLECTSLVAVLAAKLDKPHKNDFYRYCEANQTTDILTCIERLLYMQEEITKLKAETASFEYTLNGKPYSKSLDYGGPYILEIASENMDKLKIESVNGDICVVSMFETPLVNPDKTDSNISVIRKYTVKNRPGASAPYTFKQNDIIKVEIDWNIGEKALDGSYVITDYLPSGLKPIENTYNMGLNSRDSFYEISSCEMDKQKVTFYVGKNTDKKYTLTYYARVISPGTYTADSTIIQNTLSKECINTEKPDAIIIE